MSILGQLTSTTAQVCGAKQSVVKPKSQFLTGKAEILSGMSDTFVVIPCISSFSLPPNISLTGMVVTKGKVIEQETVLKESVLALIHRDRSIPTHLRLKKGSIKELDEGIFAKRRTDGILEIYVSEE